MQGKRYLLVLILLLNFVPLSFAQDARPIVRLIYFLPNDRDPQPDIDEKMDRLIKDAQQFYADQMEEHGFGRKTFLFETDANGKAVVHRVIGQHTDQYYTDLPSLDILIEIADQFDLSRNYYLIAIDISNERLNLKERTVCGIGGSTDSLNGGVLIPASGICVHFELVAHELGHAFGLEHHDFRDDTYILSYGLRRNRISKCTAEWLDVHRAFNTDQPTADTPTIVEMLPPSLAAPPNAIRLRFKVSDPDGIHQVQLLRPEWAIDRSERRDTSRDGGLIACKRVNGISDIVEFVTTDLTLRDTEVYLNVIDINGNLINDIDINGELLKVKVFPIDVSALLPPPEVVSIPDLHLAAAVRESIAGNIDLDPNDAITTHTMQYLWELYAWDSEITDLTGLEHAQLRSLGLSGNNITDVAPLAGLTQLRVLDLRDNNIADVASLAELTQLRVLDLRDNNITDVTPIVELSQLNTLYIGGNNIADVAPLAGLTQLEVLDIGDNNIADVAPLAGLTQLEVLYIGGNNIADVAPLAGLTQLEVLYLRFNPLSYASINTHIPAMQAKGVVVLFFPIAHPALLKISGDSQVGFAGKVLSSPFVVALQDEKGEPMPDVSVTFTVNAGDGKLTDTTTMTDANGYTQTTLTLGWTPGINKVRVSAEGIKSEATFTASVILPQNHVAADVNADAVVDVKDLVLVAATIGMTPPEGILPNTDVNGDGIVNNEDIALVLAALDATLASPASVWTAENLQRWIDKAKQHNISDLTFRQGIAVLEQLLATLQPKATVLLANYPNPFNPETWIPYHLAQSTEVTLQIYAINGALVRTLILGHQSAGIYEHRSRAAYWDGKNALGEPVASGLYFYTLTAGEFTATRKMLIQK